jgi:type I restriction enzyme S subunit
MTAKSGFYAETNFKEVSELGKIPAEWEVVQIGDVLSLEYGSGLPDRERTHGPYPVVGSNGIIGYHSKAIVKGPGIVVGRKGSIGAVSWIDSDFWPIDTTFYVKIETSNIFLKWLFYELVYLNLGRFRLADVVPGLKRELVHSLKMPLPPFSEQQKIAEILSTVDEAIQKTDEVIATSERLKKGLMQELLTKGIGHKEFKDTEIGRIPKDWEVIRIQEVADIRSNRSKLEVTDKVAFIPMELIPNDGIYADFKIRDFNRVSSYTYCEAGDILLAKITPSLENGKQGIVPSNTPKGFALATTEVFPIVCRNIERMFVFYLLKYPKFRKILESSMRATTGRLRVPKEALLHLKIPLPKFDEQQKIAEILTTIDRKLEIERKEKARLEKIKQGLMDLLLTGKIRVKVV